MKRFIPIAMTFAISLMCMPSLASADTEYTGGGKNGGFFRITVPTTWDGDLVIMNHGFDLNDEHIRPHHTCTGTGSAVVPCTTDVECGSGNSCNNISYSGIDQIVLPMGKAIAAGTYSTSGWAPFESAKDIKDILKFMKKEAGLKVERVIITGFSGGGAVTVDAMVKLKIDGAVPLCAASGGGLPTWDVAQDVRLVYDFLCDDVDDANFVSYPDQGEQNDVNSSDEDALTMALKVDKCLGVIGFAPHEPGMDTRLADFLALTSFDGGAGNVATAMGFATLGLGDFVRDPNRLDGARIGNNLSLDYSVMDGGSPLAASFNAPRTCSLNSSIACVVDTDCNPATEGVCQGGVKRLDAVNNKKGRKALGKAYNPDFTKGKGKSVKYPIVAMAGAADWLVIPEFQQVFNQALDNGTKAYTQTWIDTFGHCVFTPEETTAVFNKFFEWLGPLDGPQGNQPTKADIHAECLDLSSGNADVCNFNDTFVPDKLYDRIPERNDWPTAALQP